MCCIVFRAADRMAILRWLSLTSPHRICTMSPNPLRGLPSVHELLESPPLKKLVERISHNALVAGVRTVLEEVGHELQTAASDRTLPSVSDLAERVARRVVATPAAALQPVINATGQFLDHGLGRAPLAEEAIAEMAAVAREYASLDINLASGRPCQRGAEIEDLLRGFCGAEAAFVVNNNAAATILSLAALASGRDVLISRSQLISVGRSYHVPDAVAASGAVLREVGTTNKTEIDDYVRAITSATAVIMLVRQAAGPNASQGAVSLAELVGLGKQRRLPVIHNLGSATVIDLEPLGIAGQPVVGESIAAGADLVLLSGDKLLGGPQCGIIVGRAALIETIKGHPLARAMRVDKLRLAALAATLRLYRDPQQARLSIPILHLLTTAPENLKNRAERLAPQAAAAPAIAEAEAVADTTRLDRLGEPTCDMPTWCLALRPAAMTVDGLAAALRAGTPAVVGRLGGDRLLLDLRTVPPVQDIPLIRALERLGEREGSSELADKL